MTHLRDHLQAIYDERGTLTPALVVDAARDETHPLHNRFEWNDTAAAEKYRQVQAGELIRQVKVQYIKPDGKPAPVRAFVPVRHNDIGPADFQPVETAMSDDITQKIVLREFERALSRLKAQYGHLREYSDLIRQHLQKESA